MHSTDSSCTVTRPSEHEIYQKLWDMECYRTVSPGVACVDTFLRVACPPEGSTILDLGCGTGKASIALVSKALLPTLVDFTDNCRDKDALHLPFIQADLSKPLPVSAPYGFCTDVLEHIPEDQIDAVLNNILQACQYCFFQIATREDVWGEPLVGHKLHLSVRGFNWWYDKFVERDCNILYSMDLGGAVQFYVTAWQDGQAIVDIGVLNTLEDQVLRNVKYNIRRGYQQVTPHPENDIEVMIVGGGPSLDSQREDIVRLRESGVKLITLNGAYNWCLDNGITPSGTIIVDAREFNNRFVTPSIPDCKYFLASQCDPSLYRNIPPEQIYQWHTSAEFIQGLLNEYLPVWYGIPGGSTVLLRAIPLLRMLGFHKFHLFGCDSCLSEDQHHAYLQSENNNDIVVPVTVGGRVFHCNPWMISQAQEMVTLIKVFGDEFELQIHGGGLLAWILEHGHNMEVDSNNMVLRPDTGKFSVK